MKTTTGWSRLLVGVVLFGLLSQAVFGGWRSRTDWGDTPSPRKASWSSKSQQKTSIKAKTASQHVVKPAPTPPLRDVLQLHEDALHYGSKQGYVVFLGGQQLSYLSSSGIRFVGGLKPMSRETYEAICRLTYRQITNPEYRISLSGGELLLKKVM